MMKLRMSRIVAWIESIARSARAAPSAGILPDDLGQVLERERDRVQALDDRVVQVLADALALLDDRQPADLVVQTSVLDGNAGMQGEALDAAADRRR